MSYSQIILAYNMHVTCTVFPVGIIFRSVENLKLKHLEIKVGQILVELGAKRCSVGGEAIIFLLHVCGSEQFTLVLYKILMLTSHGSNAMVITDREQY